jgi:DNA-binding HxlR family transcriptional regulator
MLQGGTFLSAGFPDVTESCKLVGEILGRIGDQWSVVVVMSVRDCPRRFSEVCRAIPAVSQRMLALRELERDGLVSRKVTPTIPPRVDYELTALGRSLQSPVIALGQWAMENLPDIQAARAVFDATAKAS